MIIDTTVLAPSPNPPQYYENKDKYLYFIAKDKAGNYNAKAALLHINQGTDRPVISIPGFDPAQRSQALLDAAANPNRLDADRVLSGTFTDDDGVFTSGSIQLSIYQDGDSKPKAEIAVTAAALSVSNGGRTVNFNVDLPPSRSPEDPPNAVRLSDGTYSLEMVIKDDSAAKNELKPASVAALSEETVRLTDGDAQKRRIYFVLDTEPPVLTETAIGSTDAAPYLTGNLFALAGEVSDINGLRSLKIIQTETGVGSKTILDKTYAAPDNKKAAWPVPALSLPQAWDSAAAVLRAGSFTYEIIAEDVARRTTRLTREIVVDTVPPDLTVELPAQDSWADGSFAALRGKETDDHRVGPVFYVVDKAPNPSLFSGKTRPEDYRGAASRWTELVVLETGWSDTIFLTGNNGIGEGISYLHVAAFDAAGNLTTNAESIRKFGVDQAAPDLNNVAFAGAVDNVSTPWHVRSRFNLEGLVTDHNGLADITLTEQRDGGQPVTLTLSDIQRGGAVGAVSWNLNVPGLPWNHADTPAAAPLSGKYTYTLTVSDVTGRADRVATNTFVIVYDVDGPVVTIVDPVEGADVSGLSVYISGTAPDAYTADGTQVWYHINALDPDVTSTPAPANPAAAQGAGWILASGGTSWSHNADLTDFIGEGDRWLHVIAFDRLGNTSGVVNRKFNIDNAPPQIDEWKVIPDPVVVENANYAGKGYVIKFDAYDSNELKSLEIKRNNTVLEADGQPHADVSGTYTLVVDTTDPKRWPVTLTLENQAEGDYSYVITIYDVKDKQNTLDNNGDPEDAHKNYSVRVDTLPPVLTVGNPAANFYTGEATIYISGTAIDATSPDGVQVYYRIDSDAAPAVSLPGTREEASASFDWTYIGGATWNGSVSIPS